MKELNIFVDHLLLCMLLCFCCSTASSVNQDNEKQDVCAAAVLGMLLRIAP